MLKKILLTKCFAVLLLVLGCCPFAACGVGFGSGAAAQKGYVSGTVTDSRGNPLEGVTIIVDHSIFYNSNLTALTDAAGKYRIKIPTGSWHAFAQLKKNYNGKTYSFYLKPDNYAGFGGEGAVRNFVWALTGERQEPLAPGFFGGTVTFDNYSIENIIADENEIEFLLKPVGKLIDGSEGETLTLHSTDAYRLLDVPIGRYEISASHGGRRLKLRKWRTNDEFAETVRMDFEPEIPAQCSNCMALEYK